MPLSTLKFGSAWRPSRIATHSSCWLSTACKQHKEKEGLVPCFTLSQLQQLPSAGRQECLPRRAHVRLLRADYNFQASLQVGVKNAARHLSLEAQSIKPHLEPSNVFHIPSSVAFCQCCHKGSAGTSLAPGIEQHLHGRSHKQGAEVS